MGAYKTIRLVLACGDLEIDQEKPMPGDTRAEYVLREKANWMPTHSKPGSGQKAAFQLDLGCKKELNTFEVRNSNNAYRSTRSFNVSASNSSKEGSIAQVIVKNGEMEDSRNKENKPNTQVSF